MPGYEFHGRLCGFLCEECSEPLAHAKVRLYRAADDAKLAARAVARPKETFALLSRDEAEAKDDRLLAEAETDDQGAFTVELGEEQRYEGEPFEIDVALDLAAGAEETPDGAEPLQFTITTLQPTWRPKVAGGFIAGWEYCLPWRLWCAIRARFGLWTICGEVTVCDDGSPVAGVTVRAFDADWLQHDPLGSATTDASGHFRIDYSVGSFLRTPFSWLNIEFLHGPDLYFRVETPDGTVLLNEPPSRGRQADRDNVGPCFCVKLCLEETPRGDGVAPLPLFTNVGMYDVDPTVGDFAADGTTTAGGYAFTGTIPLRGILPSGSAPDAERYRFLAEDVAAPGAQVVDASMIAPTVIGKLEYFDWNPVLSVWQLRARDVWVNNAAAGPVSIQQPSGPPISVPVNVTVAPDGWIDVPRQNALAAGGEGLFVAGGGLVDLDTTKLAAESFDLRSGPAPLPLDAGESVPPAQRAATPVFRITFEAQKIAGSVPIGSNTLDQIAISNTSYAYTRHPEWAGGDTTAAGVVSLRIAEMVAPGSSGCDEIGDELHALFTAYHPYLGSVQLWFEGNPPLPAPISPPVATDEALSPAGGELFVLSGLDPCAYILWLSATLKLTSGFGLIPGATLFDHIAFCKS